MFPPCLSINLPWVYERIAIFWLCVLICICSDRELNSDRILNSDMANVQPIVFLSHGGGPSYFIDAKIIPAFKGMDKESEAAEFLRNFTKKTNLKKPKAILVVSAHWETVEVTVNTNTDHTLYFDYSGFPPETYKLQWPAKGSPEVARDIASLLAAKGIASREDSRRGLDHGVFVPLKLVYPEADIPGMSITRPY